MELSLDSYYRVNYSLKAMLLHAENRNDQLQGYLDSRYPGHQGELKR